VNRESTKRHALLRSPLAILFGLNCLLLLALLGISRGQRSTQDTYNHALAQLANMKIDAARIVELRSAPQRAAMRTRSDQELLAQVEAAVDAAGVKRERWRESIPQPIVRLAKSNYKQQTTRCFFEGVTLRDLAKFANKLQAQDSTIRIGGINLTNREPESPAYDVDLSLSYLVYSPLRQAGSIGKADLSASP